MIDCFPTYHPILHLVMYYIVFVGNVTELKFTEVRTVMKCQRFEAKI